MTTGHGTPDGEVWKCALGVDTLVSPGILLGRVPASLDVTSDGLYGFSASFDLHGVMVPNTISVVDTPTMTEVAQVETCTMPLGSHMTSVPARRWPRWTWHGRPAASRSGSRPGSSAPR